MLASGKAIERMYVGAQVEEVLALPNLVDIQLSSYDKFLQRGKLITHEPLELQGLEEVFQSTFPIESPSGDMILEYVAYTLDEANIKFSEIECKQKGLSYSVPIKAKINLIFQETGEIRQKDIYVGDIPLMTDRGTFIINGAERVVVSQIHRSPGVIFSHEKGVYSSRIIPYRGSWLEFEIDHKKDLVYAKIDRKKRILGTLFLRALGYDSREKILELYYDSKKLSLAGLSDAANLNNIVLFKDIFINEGEERKKLYRAGDRVHPHEVDELIHSGVTEVEVIDMESENSLHAQTVLRCFEIEDAKHTRVEKGFDEPTKEDALVAVYSVLMPGEPITLESAEKDLNTMFFTYRRYDLGRVGRYKLNKKYDYDVPMEEPVLTKTDIVNTMSQLIKVYMGDANVDDIDHLGNRRIRSVGELMQNQLKTAFTRMERIAKERMNLETETVKPQDLISIKPVVAAIKEFFGSSQLSQFMDQINPLAELTHNDD